MVNMVQKKNWYSKIFIIVLCVIALFGFIIRVVGLDRVPPGISTDVLLYFSNARAIAETGKDIYGKFFPLFSSHKGFLLSPIFMYVLVLFYKLFGFSFTQGYIPNVIISSISIMVIGLLATLLTGRKRIGIIAAIFLTISPWHYHLSRTGFEGVFAFCLVLFGVYFSIKAIQKPTYYVISFLLFVLAVFSYKAVNIFLLLYPILFFITVAWKKVPYKNILLYTLGIWLTILIQWFFLFVYYRDAYATGFIQNNIQKASIIAQEERVMSDAPHVIRLFTSNTPISLLRIYFTNYIHFFSPQYLLTNGDNDLRYSTGKGGQIYILDVLFIICGLIWLIRNKKAASLQFLSGIIIIAPIASLISDQEYAIRTFISIFSIAILVACGVDELLRWVQMVRHRKIIVFGIGILYALLAFLYFYQYHFLYIHYAREAWGGVTQEIYVDAYRNQKQYKHITFGRSSEFDYLGFMFWNRLPIEDVQQSFASYDEKKLTYNNIDFVRTCSFTKDDIDPDSINENDLLYTPEPCIKDIPPLKRYYLPKTLIWLWKSYDKKTIDNYFTNKPIKLSNDIRLE